MKILTRTVIALAIAGALFALPSSALACGSCYGAADSPQTNGMNFAILSMIGVTSGMLAAMTSFFLYLRRRARAYLAVDGSQESKNDNGGLR
jgi:hypothetical protein